MAKEKGDDFRAFLKQMRAIEDEKEALRQALVGRDSDKLLTQAQISRALRSNQSITLPSDVSPGGKVTLSPSTLKQIAKRKQTLSKKFSGQGKTIERLLREASPSPTFSSTNTKVSHDIKKAQILSRPVLVSVKGDTLTFRTRKERGSASKEPYYKTEVELKEWFPAMQAGEDFDAPSQAIFLPNVKEALSGNIAVGCSCGRWDYWFRYKATIGGYAIQKENIFSQDSECSAQGKFMQTLDCNAAALKILSQCVESSRQAHGKTV